MKKLQMSETMFMGILLALTGGFLDAYTYICRGHVFANAQTGNVVLFGLNLAEMKWRTAFGYLIPIFAFVLGVFVTEIIKHHFKNENKIHWRQIIIGIEIAALVVVAFIPQNLNMIANATVSFVCALQVDSFRKIHGNACVTTMCTGNLRTATELLCNYMHNGDKSLKKKSMEYYLIDIIFVFGAVAGTLLSAIFLNKTVLFGCVVLCVAFVVMFIDDDMEKKSKSQKV